MPRSKSQRRKGRKYASNPQPEAKFVAIKTVGQLDVEGKAAEGQPHSYGIGKQSSAFALLSFICLFGRGGYKAFFTKQFLSGAFWRRVGQSRWSAAGHGGTWRAIP